MSSFLILAILLCSLAIFSCAFFQLLENLTLCRFKYCNRESLASNFLSDLAPTKTSPVDSEEA